MSRKGFLLLILPRCDVLYIHLRQYFPAHGEKLFEIRTNDRSRVEQREELAVEYRFGRKTFMSSN